MSASFYDALADDYDTHFAMPHRAAYDRLAWEAVSALLPQRPATVIDAGCGVGRWAEKLLALGHRVVGVERAPRMAEAARRRLGDHPGFTLVEGDMATVEDPALSEGAADVVFAMGSVQYTTDPGQAIARLAGWTREGGAVAVLVDSLVALVLELWAAGRVDEAQERLRSRRGLWVQPHAVAEMHLFDRVLLRDAFVAAGMADVEVRGLLIGASALGRDRLVGRLEREPDAVLAEERRIGTDSAMADAGKQLLGIGHRCRVDTI